jgi:SpoVK/Ycf46/Vps4 family AAA+-type ATPase
MGEEVRVKVEDGSDMVNLTLKLREPGWSLDDFPKTLAEELRYLVVNPIKEDKSYGVRGMIVVGPPGMGKSVLVEAIAKEMGKRIVDIEPATYRSMWYGHTEKILRGIFNSLKKRDDIVVLIDDAEFLMNRNMMLHEGSVSELSTFLKIFQERFALEI